MLAKDRRKEKSGDAWFYIIHSDSSKQTNIQTTM